MLFNGKTPGIYAGGPASGFPPGDVVGPAASTDHAVARFDGVTGRLLQDSVVIIGDTGGVTGVISLAIAGAVGIDITPVGDANADLITVGVTGAPKFHWVEASDAFAINKGLIISAGDLGVTGTRVTKGWLTDVEVTNAVITPGIQTDGNTATISADDDGGGTGVVDLELSTVIAGRFNVADGWAIGDLGTPADGNRVLWTVVRASGNATWYWSDAEEAFRTALNIRVCKVTCNTISATNLGTIDDLRCDTLTPKMAAADLILGIRDDTKDAHFVNTLDREIIQFASLDTALPNTASVDTGVDAAAVACTAHALNPGDAVRLPTGAASAWEVFTVLSVTDADNFTLDSNATNTIASQVGYSDNELFNVRTGDQQDIFAVDRDGLHSTPASTGGMTTSHSEATVDITAVATVTIQVDVPIGAKLIGVQIRVDTAMQAGETWDAVWDDGAALQSIATNQAVAQNTKVSAWHDDNANTPLCDAETDITIERNSNPGVDSFTATGTIRAIAYYEEFITMGDF